MQFTLANIWVALLALLFSSVASSPIDSWPRSLESHSLRKRGLPGAVYICTGTNFQADCGWNEPSSECRILGTGAFGPKSIGPDPGGFCNLFTSADCSGTPAQTLRFPGSGSGFSANIQSLKCSPDSGAAPNVTSFRVDDKRLAGGVGSMERKRYEKQIDAMQKDGFREGLIGVKKNMYY